MNHYFTRHDLFSYEYIAFVNETVDDAFENLFKFRQGSLDLFDFMIGVGQ